MLPEREPRPWVNATPAAEYRERAKKAEDRIRKLEEALESAFYRLRLRGGIREVQKIQEDLLE